MPRTYESIRTEAILTRKANDTNEWKMGDLVVELEDLGASLKSKMNEGRDYELDASEQELAEDARKLIGRLADDIGVPKKSLIIRGRISRRVAEDGPLGWIRDSTLTYACLRELYALEKDEDLQKLAKKAVSQNLTVREVRTEMEQYRDGKAVAAGLYLCQTCSEPIQDEKDMVVISKSAKRLAFCGWNCGSIYASVKAQEEGPILQLSPAQKEGVEDEYDYDYEPGGVEMAL